MEQVTTGSIGFMIVVGDIQLRRLVASGCFDVQANGWAGGHNAQPLADGQCCSNCNGLVIIARMRQAREYAEEAVS